MPGHLKLATLVERMTSGLEPFGLLVPMIAQGAAANICLADLSATWEVGDPGYESRSINNAFAGRALTGRVLVTVADGAVAYRERNFAIGIAR
jgi:dihydroorotase